MIDHARTLDERQYAYLQCAVLYTSVDGQRRVRTCNLALQVVSLAGNVFRHADMDAVVCHLARDCELLLSDLMIPCSIRVAMASLSSRRMAQIREDLTDKCSSILLGYRRNCAAATAHSQVGESNFDSCAPLKHLVVDNTGSLPSTSALHSGHHQDQTLKRRVFVTVDQSGLMMIAYRTQCFRGRSKLLRAEDPVDERSQHDAAPLSPPSSTS